METPPLRISAVSYINAKPFVYGIEHAGFLKNYSLSLDIPSVCAQKLMEGKADIGLAPVAIIPDLKEYYLFPDFCIGANGAVTSVMLYSEVPLNKITKIYLDSHSRTSNRLAQVLAKFFWKISPQWAEGGEGYENQIKGTVAGLMIGDKNFSAVPPAPEKNNKYPFSYDLAEQWKLYTGLPFVFACWITNRELPEAEAISFYKSLKFGIENREKVVEKLKTGLDEKTISTYLNQYINYSFDRAKRTAMDLFLKLNAKLEGPGKL